MPRPVVAKESLDSDDGLAAAGRIFRNDRRPGGSPSAVSHGPLTHTPSGRQPSRDRHTTTTGGFIRLGRLLISFAVLFVSIALVFAAPSPGDPAPTSVLPVGPTATAGPPPCKTVSARDFNSALRLRRKLGGNRNPKFAHKPVCVRPRYRKVQADIKRLRRKLGTDAHVAIPKAFHDAGIGWRTGEALRVARCESGFNRFARNSGGYSGLFQLSYAHQARMRGIWWNAYDNAYHAAITVRADGGWSQWECKP